MGCTTWRSTATTTVLFILLLMTRPTHSRRLTSDSAMLPTLSPLRRVLPTGLFEFALYGFHLRDRPLGLSNLHGIFQPTRTQLKPQIEQFLRQLLGFLGKFRAAQLSQLFEVHLS